MQTNTIYLVRHGENPANVTREFSSRKVDHPLTPRGVLQAHQTAAFFREKPIHAVYASPLKRAAETAAIIAEAVGLPVELAEEFREIDVGALEGLQPTPENWRRYVEVIARWQAGEHEASFPEGENFVQLYSRMRAGLARTFAGGGGRNIVIVGHGGIFATTVRALCHSDEILALTAADNPNCSITVLTVWQSGVDLAARLETWAACEHLSGEAAEFTPPAHIPNPAEALEREG